MSKRRVKPFVASSYLRTHRGTPLPPPLGTYGYARKRSASPGRKSKKVNNSDVAAAVLANLILQALELFVWASVLWVIGDQLREAGVVNSNLPYFDFFWLAGLVIFAVRFSKGITSSLSGGRRDTGLHE